jgi:hypothetical protein
MAGRQRALRLTACHICVAGGCRSQSKECIDGNSGRLQRLTRFDADLGAVRRT